MRLHLLPRDALDNVLSRLTSPDILAIARASPLLTRAVAAHIRDHRLRLDPHTKPHVLACGPRVGRHIRRLAVTAPLRPAELARLARVCTRLADLSFNVPGGVPPVQLAAFLAAVAPTLRRFALEFCGRLAGHTVLPALADSCAALHSVVLRFAPRVDAPHVAALVANVAPTLRVLELESCGGVDDHALVAVAACCHSLRRLCVGGSEDVGDRGVIAIAHSPCARSLTALDIRACMRVTDAAVFALATSCSALEYLNLWRVCLTSYAVRAVAEGLGTHLNTLVIGDCIGVDDTALYSIADNCDTLVTLEMCGLKRITDYGVMALFDSARTGALRLQTLTVDRCTNISESAVLAATGLWHKRCATMCTDDCLDHYCHWQEPTQTFSSSAPTSPSKPRWEQLVYDDSGHETAPCDPAADIQDHVSGRPRLHAGGLNSGAVVCPCNGPRTNRGQRRAAACYQSRDADSFSSKSYVSYLRKLSAIDIRVEHRAWERIRECRSDLELCVDDGANIDQDSGQNCAEGACWESSCVECGMDSHLRTGFKRRLEGGYTTDQTWLENHGLS